MVFDPDRYLQEYGSQAVAAPPKSAGFDPDEYLREFTPVKFDPDRYIQEQTQRAVAPQEPTISQDELIAREGAFQAAPERGFMENMQESFARGDKQAAEDQLWYDVKLGLRSEDEAKKYSQELRDLDVSDPIKASNWFSKTFHQTAQMTPAMMRGYATGAAVGAGFAGMTSASGVGVVAAPEAFAGGLAAGSTMYWYRQGAGAIYKQLRDEGVNPKIASTMADVGGLPYALLEHAQIARLIPGGGPVLDTLTNIPKRTVKKVLLSILKKYGKNWVENVGQEGLQRIVSDTADLTGRLIDKEAKTGTIGEEAAQMGINALEEMKGAAGPMALLGLPGAGVETLSELNTHKGKKGVAEEISTIFREAEAETTKEQAAEAPQAPQMAAEQPIAPVEAQVPQPVPEPVAVQPEAVAAVSEPIAPVEPVQPPEGVKVVSGRKPAKAVPPAGPIVDQVPQEVAIAANQHNKDLQTIANRVASGEAYGKTFRKDERGYTIEVVNAGALYPEGWGGQTGRARRDKLARAVRNLEQGKKLTAGQVEVLQDAARDFKIADEQGLDIPSEGEELDAMKYGRRTEKASGGEIPNNALVHYKGEWYKAEHIPFVGTELKDGHTINIEQGESVDVKGVVKPGDELYERAVSEYKVQEGERAKAEGREPIALEQEPLPSAPADKARPPNKPAIETAQPEPLAKAGVEGTITKGVGAAAAASEGEFAPKGKVPAVNVTGLRESVAAVERKALGLPAEVKAKARKFPELIGGALDRLAVDPKAGSRLVDELRANPRPLSDLDVGLLTVEKADVWQEYNDAASENVSLSETGTDAQKEASEMRVDAARTRLEDFMDVLARGQGKSITMGARGLSALRLMVDESYNVVEMERAVKDQQGGKDLSESQKVQIEKIKRDYEQSKTRLEEQIGRLEAEAVEKERMLVEAQANAEFSAIVEEILKGRKTQVKTSEKMFALAKKMKSHALAELRSTGSKMSSGVSPMPLVAILEYGTAEVIELSAKGVVTIEQWASNMREAFPAMSSMSDRDLKKTFLEAIRDAEKLSAESESELVLEEIQKTKKRKPKKTKTVDSVVGEIKDSVEGEGTVFSSDIKALYRLQVESGVTTLAEATENVRKQLETIGVTMTATELQEAFSDYGKSRKMSRTETDRIMADLRRQSQLLASIRRVARKLAPLKTGGVRDQQSALVRDLTRQLNGMMKEAGITLTDPGKQLANSLSATKRRLQNSIEDMTNAIKAGKRMASNKGPGPTDAEIESLVTRRDALRAEYDAIFGKPEMTDEQRLNAAIKATERNLKRWNEALEKARKGDFNRVGPDNKPLPASPTLKALRQERNAIREEIKRLKDLADPPLTPEQRAIKNKQRRLESATKEMKRRIRESDFAPKRRNEINISEDPEALAAQMENNAARMEFERVKEQARRANRTPRQVAQELSLEVALSSRNILSSFDLSALGRQGWYTLGTHPFQWAKGLAPMMKSLSKVESQKANEAVFERTNAKNGIYAKARLAISQTDGSGNFAEIDDVHRLQLVERIPGVAMSNRAYATFLNQIRVELFDMFLADSSDPTGADVAKLREIADLVSVMTGRGKAGKHAETLSAFLYAPRFLSAAAELATPYGILKAQSGESRIRTMKQYARMLGSLTIIYAINALFRSPDDPPIETDPRSADFGAITIGSYKFNPINWVRPVITILARLLSGQQKTSEGITNLRGKWLPFATEEERKTPVPFGQGMENVMTRFARSKAHPIWSTIWTATTGKDFGGEPATTAGLVAGAFSPIAIREEWEAYHIEDWDAASILSILIALGVDIKPDYKSPKVERRKYQLRGKAIASEKHDEDVPELLERAISGFYDRVDGKRKLSRSKRKEKLQAFAVELRAEIDDDARFEAAITELSKRYSVSKGVIKAGIRGQK